MITLTQKLKDLEQNPTLVSFYAKHSCKHCYGRGKENVEVTNLFGKFVPAIKWCECVKRSIQKEIEEMKANG